MRFRRIIIGAAFVAGCLASAQAQSNDNFAQRLALTGSKATAVSNNLRATKEPGEPNHAASAAGRSLWWTWTAPTTGTVNFSTFDGAVASAPRRALAIYTGNSLDSLTEAASSNNYNLYSYYLNESTDAGASLNMPVVAGTAYQIAVDSSALYLGSDDGTVVLSINATPTIISAASVNATAGTAFSYLIAASANPTAYAASDLPAGLAVNPVTGVISGTPAVAGVSRIGLSATGPGGTGTATFTLQVADPAPAPPTVPVITSAAGAIGFVGQSFGYSVYALGAGTTYTAGALPPGLSFSEGAISGTPTAAGTYVVPLSATNSVGTGHASVTIVIAASVPLMAITSDITARATVGSYFSYYISTQRGNSSDYSTATIGASGLPPGLTLDAYADITGTPTQAGVYQVNLSATNAGGTSAAIVTITVSAAAPVAPSTSPPRLYSSALGAGTVGVAFSYTLAASNSPTAFTAGSLPPGLSLNPSTGAITGAPTAAGSYAVPVSASNAYGASNATLTISVAPAGAPADGSILPLIVSPAAVDGYAGQALTYVVTAAYDGSYYSNSRLWTFTADGLPPGMSLSYASSYSGQTSITGVPTSAGTYPVKITAVYPGSPYSYPTQPSTTAATVTFSILPAAPVAPTVNGSATLTAAVGTSFNYAPAYGGNPTSFSATGLPAGIVIGAGSGSLSGSPSAAGVYQVTISATNSVGAGSAAFTMVVAPQAAPVISSGASAAGTVGSAFSYSISGGNGVTSYGASNLPPGLSLDSTAGVISGTPTAAGVYQTPISATNAAGTTNATVTITVSATSSTLPIINSAASVTGTVGQSLYYYLYASTSVTAYTASNLPPGLTLSSNTISGAPTAAGIYSVPVSAANAAGTVQATLTMIISAPGVPVLSAPGVFNVIVNQSSGLSVYATNSPTSYAATGLPAGFTFSSDGYLSGAPSALGAYTVGLSATNAAGTGHGTLTLNVVAATPPDAPVISSAAGAAAGTGLPFVYRVTASNFPASYSISSLPAGLTFSTSTGILSGTPSAAGAYALTITASNAGGTGSAVLALNVFALNPSAPLITSAAGALAFYNEPFSYAVTASGSPTQFAATGLPPGLSINSQTGVITGTSLTSGSTYLPVVTATNAVGTGKATLRISVLSNPSPPHFISPAALVGTVGQAFSQQVMASAYPYNSYTASGLPAGLTFSSNGTISGTPTSAAVGTSTVNLTGVTQYGTASGKIRIIINGDGALPVITSPAGAGGYATVPLGYAVTATNNPSSYAASGLPTGLSIDPVTGAISGSPASPGSVVSTITVTNGAGASTAYVTFNVGSPTGNFAVVTSPATIAAFTGVPLNQTVTVAPTFSSYYIQASGQPPGVNFSYSSGAFSGVPTSAGTSVASISVNSPPTTAQVAFVVQTPPSSLPVFSSSAAASGRAGEAFSFRATATNNPGAYAAANLPPGLSLDPVSGIISGVPTAQGTTAVSLSATNAAGQSNAAVTLVIAPAFTGPPTITSSPLTDVYIVGVARSTAILAGNHPVTYSASGLPAGLSVNAATGLVSGTATAAAGEYPATVTASNSYGSTSVVITFVVVATAPEFSYLTAMFDATAGVPFPTFTFSATNGPTGYAASGLPAGLTLNGATGAVTGTPSAAGIYPVSVSATNASGARTVVWTVLVRDPAGFTPFFSSYYSAEAVFAVGQSGSYYFSVSTSTSANGYVALPLAYAYSGLPAGVTGPANSASSSYLTGAPTTPGIYPVTITATASSGAAASEIVTILVKAAPAPLITSAALAPGNLGNPLSYSLTSSGLVTGYSISNLPPGLTLDPATGIISGTPTAAGTFAAAVSSAGPGGNASATVTFVIGSPLFGGLPVITSAASAASQDIASSYYFFNPSPGSFSYVITGLNSPTSFGAANLPPGVSLNPYTGLISGNPTTDGVYLSTITASNATGSSSATLTIYVTASYPNILVPLLTSGYVGSPLSFYISAYQTYTYSVNPPNPLVYAAGNLPPGLSVNTATGLIQGTPTRAGTYLVSISASNRAGINRVIATLDIGATAPVPTLTVPSLYSDAMAVGYVGAPFTYMLLGNATSYAASGLPDGLAIDPARGTIKGTATTAGTFAVQVSATNSAGTSQAVLTIAINAAPAATNVSSAAGATAYVGSPFYYYIYGGSSIFGLSPTSYSAGTLPAGLTFNPVNGLISGTPTGPTGISSIPITVSYGSTLGSASLNLTVVPALTSSMVALSSAAGVFGILDNPFSYAVGTRLAPASGLPAGLTFDSATGVISGMPLDDGLSAISLAAGGSTATLGLNLVAPDLSLPRVTLPPVGATVLQNGAVTFTAAAVGAPAPAYQWTHNGAPIAGAVSAVLTINSAQPADTGRYALMASNAAGQTVSSSVNLLVRQSYGSWQTAHFTTGEIKAGRAGDDVDFAGDGIVNLVKYALGLDPKTSGVAGLPAVTFSPAQGALQIAFTRDAARPDIDYVVESTADLTHWTAIASSTEGSPTMNSGALGVTEAPLSNSSQVAVTVKAAAGAAKGAFLRLRINRASHSP